MSNAQVSVKMAKGKTPPAEELKREFIRVPDGRYLAKITRIQDRTSERTGSKGVQVTLEIIKGGMMGNAVFENFPYDGVSQKALEVATDRSKKLGRIFNLRLSGPGDILENQDELLEQELIINVKNTEREYGGEIKTFTNVTKFEAGL